MRQDEYLKVATLPFIAVVFSFIHPTLPNISIFTACGDRRSCRCRRRLDRHGGCGRRCAHRVSMPIVINHSFETPAQFKSIQIVFLPQLSWMLHNLRTSIALHNLQKRLIPDQLGVSTYMPWKKKRRATSFFLLLTGTYFAICDGLVIDELSFVSIKKVHLKWEFLVTILFFCFKILPSCHLHLRDLPK